LDEHERHSISNVSLLQPSIIADVNDAVALAAAAAAAASPAAAVMRRYQPRAQLWTAY